MISPPPLRSSPAVEPLTLVLVSAAWIALRKRDRAHDIGTIAARIDDDDRWRRRASNHSKFSLRRDKRGALAYARLTMAGEFPNQEGFFDMTTWPLRGIEFENADRKTLKKKRESTADKDGLYRGNYGRESPKAELLSVAVEATSVCYGGLLPGTPPVVISSMIAESRAAIDKSRTFPKISITWCVLIELDAGFPEVLYVS